MYAELLIRNSSQAEEVPRRMIRHPADKGCKNVEVKADVKVARLQIRSAGGRKNQASGVCQPLNEGYLHGPLMGHTIQLQGALWHAVEARVLQLHPVTRTLEP